MPLGALNYLTAECELPKAGCLVSSHSAGGTEPSSECATCHTPTVVLGQSNALPEKKNPHVVSTTVKAFMTRFAAAEGEPAPEVLQSEEDEFAKALDTWNRMDLANVHGFPVWEADVFELLKVCVDDGHPTNEFPPMCCHPTNDLPPICCDPTNEFPPMCGHIPPL